ncbi:hypothetical protein PRUPE_6G353800 [Prunus persica]|uniref:Uncharacterized protein n=1 Tax=Prunus persica TaxID=3760 RepID=A0A251P0H1_PRUPE|nr:hypothetical protein PRUPE_6G353800 [Prunus persica]
MLSNFSIGRQTLLCGNRQPRDDAVIKDIHDLQSFQLIVAPLPSSSRSSTTTTSTASTAAAPKKGEAEPCDKTEVHAKQINSINSYKLLQERAPLYGSGTTIQNQRVLAILNSACYVEAGRGQGRPSRLKICTREVGGLDTQTSGLDLDSASDAR